MKSKMLCVCAAIATFVFAADKTIVPRILINWQVIPTRRNKTSSQVFL